MKLTKSWPVLLGLAALITYSTSCSKSSPTITKTVTDTLVVKDTVTDTLKAPSYADSVKRSLWAYYKFSGNFADSSGNNRNLTPLGGLGLGMDIVGNVNGALDFNGGGNYAVIDSGVNFPAGNFTVSMLCLFNSTGGSRIFQKVNYTDATGASFGFGFSTTANDAFSFFVATDPNVCSDVSNNTVSLLNLSQPEQTGIWYYVTFVFNNGVQSVYVDGTLAGSQTTTSNTFATCNSAPFYLGSWWAQDPLFFSGVMDEVRIYTRALSQSEITYLSATSAVPL